MDGVLGQVQAVLSPVLAVLTYKVGDLQVDAELLPTDPNDGLLSRFCATEACGRETPDAGQGVIVIGSLDGQEFALGISDDNSYRFLG